MNKTNKRLNEWKRTGRNAGKRAFVWLCLGAMMPAGTHGEERWREAEPTRLEAIEVPGSRNRDYWVEVAPLTLKTRVPVLETPLSLQVVSRQVMEDQGALRLDEVYRNVSGVVQSGNTLNAQSEVLPFIRGFEAPVFLRNGLRAGSVGAVDLANIESAEVLKGPASILFGALEPGGVVNYTTKRPLGERFTEIKQQLGSWEHLRTALDTTGALAADGSFYYRLNSAFTSGGSFRDEIDPERYVVAPSLLWRVYENTELFLEMAYTKETVAYDSGIPVDQEGHRLVSREVFFGDPTLDGRTLEDLFVSFSVKQVLNDFLTLRHGLQVLFSTPRNESIRHRGLGGTPEAPLLRVRYQNEEREDTTLHGTLDLLGEFSTGFVHHHLVAGVEGFWQENEFDRYRQNLPDIAITEDPQTSFTPPSDLVRQPAFRDNIEWYAFYFHDQMAIGSERRLHALVGGRYDDVREEDQLAGEVATNAEWTGRFGLLYKLLESLSPYASVTQSFQPAGAGTRDRAGKLLSPETGIQVEAGLKLNYFAERLQATLAAYRIEKEDVAVFDNGYFFETGNFASLPGVNQRSQGLELDISGQLTKSIRVILNYAYTDARETQNLTNPSSVGSRLGNVPFNSLRLWAAYEFASNEPLDGLGLGVGYRFEGERPAQFDSTLLGSYSLFDLSAWYSRELSPDVTLKFKVSWQNLFDEDYMLRASDASIAHPGKPRSILASVGLEF